MKTDNKIQPTLHLNTSPSIGTVLLLMFYNFVGVCIRMTFKSPFI